MHLYFSFTINKILQNKLNDNQNHKHCEKKSIENHKKNTKKPNPNIVNKPVISLQLPVTSYIFTTVFSQQMNR